jgi:hypothetical protein
MTMSLALVAGLVCGNRRADEAAHGRDPRERPDFRDGYRSCRRSDGERAPTVPAAVQASAPRPVDVRTGTPWSSGVPRVGSARGHSRYSGHDLRASCGAAGQWRTRAASIHSTRPPGA